MSEPVLGNHIGFVVDNNDPSGGSGLKIFVPNVTNTLIAGWNDQLKDISFKSIETQQSGGITSTILDRLKDVLPWAQPAAPFFGGGTSAPVNTTLGAATLNPQSNAVQAQNNPPTPISNTSQNKMIAPDQNLNQTSSGSSAALQKLAADRQSAFAQELQDPIIQNRLAATAIHEVGSNPYAQQAMMETVLNRAQFTGQSVTSILNADYGPGWGGRDKADLPASANSIQAMNNVLNGSNITGMAVDNSSNAPGNALASRNVSYGTSGYVWLDSSHGQIVTDQATIDALNAGSTQGDYELLYRGSDGSKNQTTASRNANSYADNNGLQSSALVSSGTSIIGYSPNRSMVANMVGAHLPSGGANGFYSKPSVGAKVWVFFYGGDIQRPIYFATVLDGAKVAYQS